jgi:DNA repair exonuclease SbcCD nuclease subunit
MILFFGDVHLGQKFYSSITNDGLYTAELDTRNALEEILIRASKPDIDLIIIGGDYFHTSHPTTNNIEWAIDWFYRLDELGKQVLLIPGNHDASMYSSSLVFLHELKLKNTKLIDNRDSDFYSYKWNEWLIKFVPYFPNKTLQDKDAFINFNISNVISDVNENTIIVSHIQERSAKLGSESRMIAKGVQIFDAASDLQHNTIILTGHIHARQIYKKNNIVVVYPGSLTNIDYSDVSLEKGYCLVEPDGNIIFENLKTIRGFSYYDVPENQDILEYFYSQRMLLNQVAFIHYNGVISDIDELYKYFKNIDSIIGWIKEKESDIFIDDVSFDSLDDQEILDQYTIYENYIKAYIELNPQYTELQDLIILSGKTFISNNNKEVDFEN